MAEPLEYHEREQAMPAGKEREAEPFAKMPIGSVLRKTDLSDSAVRLYGELKSYEWDNGFCFPGQDRLAADLGWSVSKVYRYTKELEAKGYISVLHRPLFKGKNRTNEYTFTDPNATVCNKPSTSGTDRSDPTDPDRSGLTDEVNTVEVEEVSPLRPPRGAAERKEEKDGSGRNPSDTSSFADQRKQTQKNAGDKGKGSQRAPRRRKPRGGVTSPKGIEAILSFEARRIDCYDPIGEDMEGRRTLLASIAERWDFASEEDPPPKLRYEISPDRVDCDRMLKRLRRMVRAADRSAQLAGLPGTEEDVKPDQPSLTSPSDPSDTPPGDRLRAEDGPSLTGTQEADPRSLEAILAAEWEAKKAEESALLKAYRKAHPEDFVLKPGDLDF